MRDPDVVVIGGGPAGVAAATEAAAKGLRVVIMDMRPALGGAIYRQPIPGGAAIPSLPSLRGRWHALMDRLSSSGAEVATRRSFVGMDSTGAVLVDNRITGTVEILRPRALILACGAVEKIRPRPGWQLPGVVAAGGLQVMLKEGRLPQGRILLGGSGPLLLALAAQMTAAGNPPIAVAEVGNPMANPLSALGLMNSPSIFSDMAVLMKPVLLKRFPWWRNIRVETIEQADTGLVVQLRSASGDVQRIEVDRIALHDGLRSNDFGLTAEGVQNGVIVLRAGDVREVLGARAAEADGQRAGREVAARLNGLQPSEASPVIHRERRMQKILSGIFRSAEGSETALDCPDETVICRCENRTLGDLKAQLSGADVLSARELRLNGRFGMGACQGRFCLDTALSVMAKLRPDAAPATTAEVAGQRWPLRPVSLNALAQARPGEDQHAPIPS